MTKKKIDSGNENVESKKTFNLVKEHPSHKYMVMSRRKHIVIPSINSINLLHNVALLDLQAEEGTDLTQNTRENYTKITMVHIVDVYFDLILYCNCFNNVMVRNIK